MADERLLFKLQEICGQLILRKIIKIVAIRCQILRRGRREGKEGKGREGRREGI